MAFLCNISVFFFLKIARGKILFFCIILSGKILSFWWCGFYEAKLGAMFISLCLLSIMFMWEICLRAFFALFHFPPSFTNNFSNPQICYPKPQYSNEVRWLAIFSSPLIFIDRTFSTFLSGKKSCFQYADNLSGAPFFPMWILS